MLCCPYSGPDQPVTEEGVSISDIVANSDRGPATGYTALPSSETEAEIAAGQARGTRVAQLHQLPQAAPLAPDLEPSASSQAATCKTEQQRGDKSSIGFVMDDKTAEALGFGPAGTSSSS